MDSRSSARSVAWRKSAPLPAWQVLLCCKRLLPTTSALDPVSLLVQGTGPAQLNLASIRLRFVCCKDMDLSPDLSLAADSVYQRYVFMRHTAHACSWQEYHGMISVYGMVTAHQLWAATCF